MEKTKNLKKKEKRNILRGFVYILATFNNTIISVSDLNGNIVAWSSAGIHGFKGSRKSTPYAAKVVGEELMNKVIELGLKTCDIYVKGPGNGRESALRAISNSGVKVNSIKDVTPVPHNGCRPPKKRRI